MSKWNIFRSQNHLIRQEENTQKLKVNDIKSTNSSAYKNFVVRARCAQKMAHSSMALATTKQVCWLVPHLVEAAVPALVFNEDISDFVGSSRPPSFGPLLHPPNRQKIIGFEHPFFWRATSNGRAALVCGTKCEEPTHTRTNAREVPLNSPNVKWEYISNKEK